MERHGDERPQQIRRERRRAAAASLDGDALERAGVRRTRHASHASQLSLLEPAARDRAGAVGSDLDDEAGDDRKLVIRASQGVVVGHGARA